MLLFFLSVLSAEENLIHPRKFEPFTFSPDLSLELNQTMKKLNRKGTVHPSPPAISDQLSFLPATILTLTAALSPEDREVLAYLISCSSNNTTGVPPFVRFSGNHPRRNNNKNDAAPKGAVDGDHPPLFYCSCFRCYMSYWVRWDSSPNHQLIHEIIDAFEDWLAQSSKGSGRKEKRNKKGSNKQSNESNRSEVMSSVHNASGEPESVGESSNSGGGGDGAGEGGDGVEDEDKGSVRRFVSFIGERIWGAWGQ